MVFTHETVRWWEYVNFYLVFSENKIKVRHETHTSLQTLTRKPRRQIIFFLPSVDTQEKLLQPHGGTVPHEDLHRQLPQGGQAQPALPPGPQVVRTQAEQVGRHASPRIRASDERLQQVERVRKRNPRGSGTRHHLHPAGQRKIAGQRRLEGARCRDRREGPRRMRVLLEFQRCK